jgi:hypothetical protein
MLVSPMSSPRRSGGEVRIYLCTILETTSCIRLPVSLETQGKESCHYEDNLLEDEYSAQCH